MTHYYANRIVKQWPKGLKSKIKSGSARSVLADRRQGEVDGNR